MPITPVPPAQPHTFPKESFSFCCSFIPPAFIHLKSPPGRAALSSMPARELCSRRVTTVEGGQFYSKSCQYIVFCLCLSGPQPILVRVCLLHVIAIFMIPCLVLNTSYTWKCSRIHGFSPSNLSAMIWPQPLVALGTGHQKDPLHLRFLQLFLQSGCG